MKIIKLIKNLFRKKRKFYTYHFEDKFEKTEFMAKRQLGKGDIVYKEGIKEIK